MKIVIDISAEDFEKVKCGRGAVSMMRKAIIHGTPLPEGAEILTKEAYSDLCTRAADVPSVEPEKCSDCINREALLRKLQKVSTEAWKMKLECNAEIVWNQCIDFVKDAPPVEPERKPGKWLLEIGDWNRWTCSECGFSKRTDIHVTLGYDYCPKCGADMREVQDESDKS